MNNLLTVEEVKNFLEIEEQELEKFLKLGKLRAYKIGGTFIRFRKEEVMILREAQPKAKLSKPKNSVFSKVFDFWKFNNFYIISLLLAAAILFVVFKS